MTDNVIPFHNNEEENDCFCESCDLAKEYLFYVLDKLDNGSTDDLFNVLRSLVEESGKLALKQYLQEQIAMDIHLLEHLSGECCDGECSGECENKNED